MQEPVVKVAALFISAVAALSLDEEGAGFSRQPHRDMLLNCLTVILDRVSAAITHRVETFAQ